jgi:hypothetical protein
MRTNISILAMLLSLNFFGQDSLSIKTDSLKTRIFSLTPRIKNVGKVNGLTFGLGLIPLPYEETRIKKVNGINLEVNPISVFIMILADPDSIDWDFQPPLAVNGLNLSTGNFNKAIINGLNVSGFNYSFSNNGISLNGFYNYSKKMNGLHISGIGNVSKNANGLFLSVINDSEILNGIHIGGRNNALNSKGLQISFYNKSDSHYGVQIGLFNCTKKMKGLQLGFWNSNGKRSMPFLNF